MLTTIAATAALVINELMAANVGEAMSPAINFNSWIEVYNPGNEAVKLDGMYLSDDANNLKRWKMPSGMGSVPAKGFKVIWLGSNDINDTQADFKLDCDGGVIYLSDANGQLLVSQNYPQAISHTAWARQTDGDGEWGWTANATPGKSNASAKFATQRLNAPVVNQGSTLFKSSVNVKVTIPAGARLMYTLDGSLPAAPKPEGDDPNRWVDYVVNGDCEASESVSLIGRNAGSNGGDSYDITNGVGYNNSRGIKVHAIANPQHDYDAQLFVYTPDHIWKTGEKYRFRMKVRADKAAKITAQTHTTPHNYIYGSILDGSYNITTQWQEITYTGTITDDQVGKEVSGGGWWWEPETVTYKDMQTIAFNLNVTKADNNFYFDEVSWELDTSNSTEEEATKESKNGQFTFNQTTNVTFRLYQDGYLPSVPVTRSYIKTSSNYTLPVISIVGDKKHFTDPKIGFDCDGDGTNGKTGNGQSTPRNYNMDWDRPVNFSYISPEGEMLHNQDVTIKVSGGWTRSQRYRSFKLKASKLFDGQNRYDYSFFPQKPYIRSKTLLVRNGGNDVWNHNARFMDPALETIIQRSGIDLDVQSYVPIIEYVNGELRGVLNLREPNNDDFAYANWGYDDEELDAFENLVMKNGDDVVLSRIFELGHHINEVGAYDELKTLLDIDEFTNYMAVTMFLDNDDWPNNNMKAYRSRNDGRYRFISFDLDFAFALRNFNKDNDDPFKYFVRFKDAETVYSENNYNKEIVNLFLDLLAHEEYRRKFVDTFCLVGGSVFEPTRSGQIVTELLNKVKPMCDLMRQQGINDGHDPQSAANTIKSKLNGRSKKMAGHLKNFSYAGLSTTAQAVTLNTDAEGAHLFVNGIHVPYADFNGHLFAPVTLRAEAPAGYRFAGWKKNGSIVSTNEEMSLPSGSSVSLTATFTKLSADELAAQGITPVRINEVSASNGVFTNEYFKRNDWIELYNTTDSDIDVAGMYLSDKADQPQKYQITKGNSEASTVIPAHGYLIVWCDKLEPQSQLHASFKLAAEGGEVLLSAADGSWTDRLDYSTMRADETVGRYPDGMNDVVAMNVPTIAKSNIISSYAQTVEQSSTGIDGMNDVADLQLKYVVGRLVLRGKSDTRLKVEIVNLAGQQIESLHVTLNGGVAEVSLGQLAGGAYIASVTDEKGHKKACKFICQ